MFFNVTEMKSYGELKERTLMKKMELPMNTSPLLPRNQA